LQEALDALERGESSTIELTGEPGSGKSRLLAEMIGDAGRRDMGVVHIRCREFEQCMPFASFAFLLTADPLEKAFSVLPDEERALITGLVGRSRTACAEREPLRTSDRYRASSAMRSLLTAGSSSRTLLVLEDFHWADPDTVELIDQLVRLPPKGPLLTVIAQRPAQASARLADTLAHGIELGQVTRVDLPPLSLDQSAELLGLSPRDSRLPELHRAAEGNPLYLIALAHEAEWSRGQQGRPRTGRLPQEVPVGVSRLLIGEVTALRSSDHLVAAAAAVLGDYCDAEALAFVAEVPRTEAAAAVDRLVERDILRTTEHRVKPRFRHQVLRRVVYDYLEPTWRAAAHRRAMALLGRRGVAAPVLACHVERSLGQRGTGDLDILVRAAKIDLLTVPGRAVRWLELALEEFPSDLDDGMRGELMVLLTRALGMDGRLPESRELLHQVMLQIPAEDHSARASVVEFSSMVECLLGNFSEARALLAGEVDRLLRMEDPPRAVATMLVGQGMIGAFDGGLPTCSQVRLATEMARRHGDRAAEAGAGILTALCDTFHRIGSTAGSLAAAAAFIDGLADSELSRHPEYLGMLGWNESLVGRYLDAERHLARGLSIARRHGQHFMVPVLLLGLGNVHRRTGHLEEARKLVAEALPLAERTTSGQLIGLAFALKATTTRRDTPKSGETAVRLAERAVAAFVPRNHRWNIIASAILAEAVFHTGDPGRSFAILLEAGGGEELPRIPAFLRAQWLCMLLVYALAAGRPVGEWRSRARRVVSEHDLASEHAYARLACGLTLLHEGDAAGAVTEISAAVDRATSAGLPHARAWMLTLLADALIAQGEERQAESVLGLAAEVARRYGNDRIRSRIEGRERGAAEAPESAARHRAVSAARPDLSILTEREREVALIVSTGLRTREVAERLSLSPRTVEAHLNRIFRKLGISSRTLLARLVSGDGGPPRPPGASAGWA